MEILAENAYKAGDIMVFNGSQFTSVDGGISTSSLSNAYSADIILEQDSNIVIDGDIYSSKEIKAMFEYLKFAAKKENPEMFI